MAHLISHHFCFFILFSYINCRKRGLFCSLSKVTGVFLYRSRLSCFDAACWFFSPVYKCDCYFNLFRYSLWNCCVKTLTIRLPLDNQCSRAGKRKFWSAALIRSSAVAHAVTWPHALSEMTLVEYPPPRARWVYRRHSSVVGQMGGAASWHHDTA